jgi:DNA-binding GntR family transcriptional regulator
MIETAIVNGDLAPATLLRQEQLSEELGVSRTPVREALQHLAATGLVTIEPNRGARVRMPSREEIKERWLIRSELEALAGELALGRMSRAQLKELRATARRLAELTDAIDAAKTDGERQWLGLEWNAASVAFHELVLDAANSPLLTRTVRTMISIARTPLTFAPNSRMSEYAHRAAKQQKEIVDAFAARDPNVREYLRQHIRDSVDLVIESLFESGLKQQRLLPLGSTPS